MVLALAPLPHVHHARHPLSIPYSESMLVLMSAARVFTLILTNCNASDAITGATIATVQAALNATPAQTTTSTKTASAPPIAPKA